MTQRDARQGLQHGSVVLAGGRRDGVRRPGVPDRESTDTGGLSRATVRTALGLFFGAVAAWMVISGLLARRWPWQLYGDQASQSDVLKLALGVVAAGGAAIALVVNYRRQQHLERDDVGKRDQIRLFTERFGAAAAQLGGDRPAVRLAGVYAMAALADEWSTRRQQCVDVLCGYLRLPYTGEPPPGHPELVVEQRHYAGGTIQRTETTTYQTGEIQVRQAIVDTIRQHLQAHAEQSWSDLTFAFTGATLVDVSFSGATFSGERTWFDGATFAGDYTLFTGATFSGDRTWFAGATFSSDRTWFDGATFSSEDTMFEGAEFSGEDTMFDGAVFSSEQTWFAGATFSGDRTSFAGAEFVGDYAWFDEAKFSGKHTSFAGATFSGEFVSFRDSSFTDVDDALHEARIAPQEIRWGPVPSRSAWPPDSSA